MQKKLYFLAAITVLVIVLSAACAPAAQPTAAPVAPAPTQPPPPVVAPTEAVAEVPETGGQTFAPACQASASACTPLDVQDTEAASTYCVKKIPYTNIMVPDGTTFEVLDKSGDFKCKDQDTFVDGKRVIACWGKELLSFRLKLTNPACGGANLDTNSDQCQEGFGYDAANQCCAPVTSGETAGSTTITVNIGACPLPQN